MARPKKHDGVLYRRGCFWWMRYRDRDGTRRLESTETIDWQEAQTRLRKRLQARDENVRLAHWFGEANNSGFTSGRTFSWSTIPSRPCGVGRRTQPTKTC